jgi:superfamily II DNA or RNA helicase
MRILIGNRFSVIEGDFPRAKVFPVTTIKTPPIWLGPKKKIAGKTIQLLKPDGSFPVGLSERVARTLPEAEVIDMRDLPAFQTPWSCNYTLRDYQQAAVEKLIAYPHRGVCWTPTASGKTYIAAEVIRRIGLPALYLVHRNEIVKQVHEKLSKWFPFKIGICTGKEFEPSDLVMVSSVYSVHKIANFDRYITLICDEAHHCPMETYQEILLGTPAPYRFGFSGTPTGRADQKDLLLIAATGEIRYQMTTKELGDMGLTPKAGVVFFPFTFTDRQSLLYERRPWNVIEGELLSENAPRNQMISEICKSAPGKILVFVNRVSHGLRLVELLKGEDVTFCSGSDDIHTRVAALTNRCKITIATKIFDEGIDVEDFETLVIASGGKSAITTMQRVGRGMRNFEGKFLNIIDIFDKGIPMLERHSKTREKIYRSLGFQIYSA